MAKNECSSCRYYIKHYTKTATKYSELLSGHCGFTTRTKARNDDSTCDNYEEKDFQLTSQQNEKIVASLLQRILEQIGRLIEVYDRGED